MEKINISIVIPTYNECENIILLVKKIDFKRLSSLILSIIG